MITIMQDNNARNSSNIVKQRDAMLPLKQESGCAIEPAYCTTKSHFLANVIFMACVGVILNPCKALLAAPDCVSFSNSTKAISWRPGTSRTSLNPGNLKESYCSQIFFGHCS